MTLTVLSYFKSGHNRPLTSAYPIKLIVDHY